MRRRRKAQKNLQWSRAKILILAVTFFAAAGLGTLGLNTISRISQAAAAGLTRMSPDSCDVARKKALGKDNDGPATDTFTGEGDGAQTLSKCYGAVITEEGRKARDNPAKYGPLQAIEKHYKCTGRESGTVTVDKNIVTSVSTATGIPGKCPENVVNKGLKDKGKGEPPKKEEPKKDDGKGESKMPELPKPPEKKPKEEKPKDDKCQRDPNSAECKQSQKPFYCNIMSSLPGCGGNEGQLPQTSPTDVSKEISDIAGPPPAPSPAPSSNPTPPPSSPQPAAVPTGPIQQVTPKEDQKALSPPAFTEGNSFKSPEFSGFTSPGAQPPLTPAESSAAWWTLEGMKNNLNSIVSWLGSWGR